MKAGHRLVYLVAAALAACGLAAYAFSTMAESAAPVDFTDTLTGPAAPQLTIPFEYYSLTPEGLRRVQAVTGRGFGNDRWVVRTISGGYLSRDFVFEIDVTIPPGTEDLAYVGFGKGERNPDFNYEPGGGFIFRIHGMAGVDRVDVAAARPVVAGRAREAGPDVYGLIRQIATYRRGSTATFRIERAGNNVTLSMPGAPGASHTFGLAEFGALFEEDEAYLFFGNSAEGTVFSNVRVRPRG